MSYNKTRRDDPAGKALRLAAAAAKRKRKAKWPPGQTAKAVRS